MSLLDARIHSSGHIRGHDLNYDDVIHVTYCPNDILHGHNHCDRPSANRKQESVKSNLIDGYVVEQR